MSQNVLLLPVTEPAPPSMKQPAWDFQNHVPFSQMRAAHQGKGNRLFTAYVPQNRALGSEKDPRLGGAGPFCLKLAKGVLMSRDTGAHCPPGTL